MTYIRQFYIVQIFFCPKPKVKIKAKIRRQKSPKVQNRKLFQFFLSSLILKFLFAQMENKKPKDKNHRKCKNQAFLHPWYITNKCAKKKGTRISRASHSALYPNFSSSKCRLAEFVVIVYSCKTFSVTTHKHVRNGVYFLKK